MFSVSPDWTVTSSKRMWSFSKRTLWFFGAARTASMDSGQCQTTPPWLCAHAPATKAAVTPQTIAAIRSRRAFCIGVTASLFYFRKFSLWVEGKTSKARNLEARVGFEPTNDGFADHSLRPLGYRALLLCP